MYYFCFTKKSIDGKFRSEIRVWPHCVGSFDLGVVYSVKGKGMDLIHRLDGPAIIQYHLKTNEKYEYFYILGVQQKNFVYDE